LPLHRTRALLVKQRTQLVNMIRGQLAEFGINLPQGLERALMLARQIIEGKEVPDLPGNAVTMLAILSRQARGTHEQIREINRDLMVLRQSDEMARRLASFLAGMKPADAVRHERK
jgi:transposase